MMIAGASPSAHDRAELRLMGTEKVTAAAEAWNAMAVQALVENQKLALSFMQSFWFPWLRPSSRSTAKQLSNAALRVLGSGMAPIHRSATSNARRLRRIKRR
jgi:hypothetical protein